LQALARSQDPGYRQSDGAVVPQSRKTVYKERWKEGRKEQFKTLPTAAQSTEFKLRFKQLNYLPTV
jgi:hypothetical protein